MYVCYNIFFYFSRQCFRQLCHVGLDWAAQRVHRPVHHWQVRSGQVRSGQVRSGQVKSGQVRSSLVGWGQENAIFFSWIFLGRIMMFIQGVYLLLCFSFQMLWFLSLLCQICSWLFCPLAVCWKKNLKLGNMLTQKNDIQWFFWARWIMFPHLVLLSAPEKKSGPD